ncbi:DinB family protein [Phytomonospora sp. NPDC050363]|uniref:DinB family protein n=1 Tax=Phytomonospora sp. NPDC050363 TaxID=3155642 RepID=UPI0033E2C8A6
MRRGRLFTGEDESRFAAPADADERTLLVEMLAAHRATLELKCAGLTAEQLASRAVPPSTLSLLGLVRHLADVERRWFRLDLAGEDAPPRFCGPEDPDGDFDGAVADNAVIEESWAAWRDEAAFADAFTARAASLDVEGEDAWRGKLSLRWVLMHMIEEYARHNGHADLLRERLDGAIGL